MVACMERTILIERNSQQSFLLFFIEKFILFCSIMTQLPQLLKLPYVLKYWSDELINIKYIRIYLDCFKEKIIFQNYYKDYFITLKSISKYNDHTLNIILTVNITMCFY
jgi:hypothetical protein